MRIEEKNNMVKKHILYTFADRRAYGGFKRREGARKNHAVVLFFHETSAEIDVTVRIKELTPSSPPPQPPRSPPPPRYPLLRASRHIISTLYATPLFFLFPPFFSRMLRMRVTRVSAATGWYILIHIYYAQLSLRRRRRRRFQS